MSLFNGFATHQMEKSYYTLVRYLVLVLEKRLLRFYQGQACNQKKFVNILNKLRTRIGRLENNKYSQPKFADSLATLLAEIRPQHKHPSYDSFQSRSILSNNDNRSQLSLDFSFDRLPAVGKLYSLPKQQQSVRPHRHNYRSFESIKTTPVITQSEEEYNKLNYGPSRTRINSLNHLKLRLQQPKLDSYIDKIRQETKMLEMMSKRSRKQPVGQVGQVYLSQRRKKSKKVSRNYQIQ